MRDSIRRELPRSRKTRGLVAYLALSARVCRREELCELLWDGAADPRGELRLRLAKIRIAVGPWLAISPEGIELARNRLSIDATKFRDLAREPLSERSIADALTTWRGPPLADVDVPGQQAFMAWLASEREALSLLRTRLLKAAVDSAWEHPEIALLAARRLVAQEPWNEWGHARVAQLLERCGRIREAAAYLAAARRSLSHALDIPESRLLLVAPPPSKAVASDRTRRRTRIARPLVRVEALESLPASGDAAKLGMHITDGLRAALWRSRTCDVLDTVRHPQYGTACGLDADFAVCGSIVRWHDTDRMSMRCVNLRLGTLLWSGHAERASLSFSALRKWIDEAADAICAAIHAAGPNAIDPTSLTQRLISARTLAGSLQPRANTQALDLLKARSKRRFLLLATKLIKRGSPGGSALHLGRFARLV